MVELICRHQPSQPRSRIDLKLKLGITLTSLLIVLGGVYGLGLAELSAELSHSWHLPSLELLRSDPWNTLVHLHSQPPFLSGVLSVLLRLPGSAYHYVVLTNSLAMALVGLVIYLVIANQGKVGHSIGWIAVIFFSASPAVLLHASSPSATCLTALGFAIIYYSLTIAPNQRRAAFTLLCCGVSYLSLLRSSFTPIHALIFLMVFVRLSGQSFMAALKPRWPLLAGATVVVLLVPTKNWILYDFWGSSSWASLNLIKGFGLNQGPHGHFPAPSRIMNDPHYPPCPHQYHPADSDILKSPGIENKNHCSMIVYAADQAPRILREYTLATHLNSIRKNLSSYLGAPETNYLQRNRINVAGYSAPFQIVFGNFKLRSNTVRLTVVALWLVSFLIAFRTKEVEWIALILTTTIHSLTYILTDGLEGQRFVVEVEALIYVASGMLLVKLIGPNMGSRFGTQKF